MPEPADAIRALYAGLLDAWNRRSAPDMAELFAPDGTLIGFDGSVASGDEVLAHLAPIFDSHPTAAYVAVVREVRLLSAQIGLLRAIVGMVPPGGADLNPAVNAHQTVLARQDGPAWRVVLLQTTPAQYHGRPDLVAEHTDELRRVLRRREGGSGEPAG